MVTRRSAAATAPSRPARAGSPRRGFHTWSRPPKQGREAFAIGGGDMILISGEALIDLIPDPDRDVRYDAVLGGSPYNVAIGLGRLGAPTAFVSRISADANGEALAAALAADGVDLGFVARDPKPTHPRLRHARHRADGIALFLLSRRDRVRWPLAVPRRLAGRRPASARRLDLAAVDPRHGESVVAALRLAREQATTSFDPNIRPLVTPDRDSGGRAGRTPGLACQPRQGERGGPRMALSRPRDRGQRSPPGRGSGRDSASRRSASAGAVAFSASERSSVAAPQVEVVDTVGAGDSFMSALLSAMDRDGALGAERADADARPPRGAGSPSPPTASAITCTRKGSDPPTLRRSRSISGLKFVIEPRSEDDAHCGAAPTELKAAGEPQQDKHRWLRPNRPRPPPPAAPVAAPRASIASP